MDVTNSVWNEDDNSNTTAAPDGAPEGMAPSGVNNVLRAHQGALKRWYNWTVPKATGGTSTAYTLSYTVAPAALVDGMTHLVQFHAANGASATLNVNSLGATPLYTYQNGAWAAAPTGILTADTLAHVSYHSSSGAYRVHKIQSSGTWTPTDGSGAGLTLSSVSGKYQVIGNMVFAYFRVTYPTTSNGSTATIGSLPLTVPNQTYATIPSRIHVTSGTGNGFIVPVVNSTTATFVDSNSSGLTNANLSTLTISACVMYPAS
jgi:hypothetical protein